MRREEYKTRLIGNRFGNLLVDDFAGYNKNKCILYNCLCDCGNRCIATYTELTKRKKDNCGCRTKEKMRKAKIKFNKYDLSGEYGIGWTTNTNKEFYFDLEDYDKIKDYCWIEHDNYLEANSKNGKNQQIKFHRFVVNANEFYEKVDHINHNTLDNRKSNLRICTNQQNCFNHRVHSNNTTGYSGINFDSEKNKYRARIFINKKGIHLGYFNGIEDAIKARRKAEHEYFKEYKIDEKYE